MGHGVDLRHCLLQCIISENGQDGTEDLFLHDGVLKRNVVHNRRSDLKGFRIAVPAAYNFFGIDQPHDPVEMFLIDDLSIISVV